ncbi:MAG: hypothetical protein HY343_12670 [Lentisphaerae bacterium]|nr:hypothetical protein [Lentisphaerota bacterium]
MKLIAARKIAQAGQECVARLGCKMVAGEKAVVNKNVILLLLLAICVGCHRSKTISGNGTDATHGPKSQTPIASKTGQSAEISAPGFNGTVKVSGSKIKTMIIKMKYVLVERDYKYTISDESGIVLETEITMSDMEEEYPEAVEAVKMFFAVTARDGGGEKKKSEWLKDRGIRDTANSSTNDASREAQKNPSENRDKTSP